jgi:hypothetical protein
VDAQVTYTSPDGGKYVGQFTDGKRNGKGTYTFSDGADYVGQWQNDRANGLGTLTSANGQKYVGQWKNGKRDGKGTLTNDVKTALTNDVKTALTNDVKTALTNDVKPALTSPDIKLHLKYVGQFKKDKYHGQGILTYSNGNEYVGQFKKGRLHGQGTLTHIMGEEYVGQFKDGHFRGGTVTYPSGAKYVGQFRGGMTVFGDVYHPDGRLIRTNGPHILQDKRYRFLGEYGSRDYVVRRASQYLVRVGFLEMLQDSQCRIYPAETKYSFNDALSEILLLVNIREQILLKREVAGYWKSFPTTVSSLDDIIQIYIEGGLDQRGACEKIAAFKRHLGEWEEIKVILPHVLFKKVSELPDQ